MLFRVSMAEEYLTQSSGELATGEISSGGGGERDTVTEVIQGDVLLYVLRELNPKMMGWDQKLKAKKEKREEEEEENLSPGSPLAAMSL